MGLSARPLVRWSAMLKNILSTITTRILVALLTLIMVLVNARYLGAEKVGTIGLIILAIAILQLVSNLVGGGALVLPGPAGATDEAFPAILRMGSSDLGIGNIPLEHNAPDPTGYAIHVFFSGAAFIAVHG